MDLRSYLRHLDYLLLAAAGGLLVFGVTMIYFATRHDTLATPFYYARNQIVFAAVGAAALVVLSLVDYEHYRRWQWPLYGFVVLSHRGGVRPGAGDPRVAALDHAVVRELPALGARPRHRHGHPGAPFWPTACRPSASAA